MKQGWNTQPFAHMVDIKVHNLLQMNEEYITPLHNKLLDIVTSVGDEQKKLSNVQADMTNWTMHTKYEEFEKLGNIVRILLAQDTLPTSENEAVQSKHKYVIREMWGAIYHKNDYTIKHWHWPCTWSFGYYLKTSETTPPIVFHNAIQGSSVGNISYNPKTGDLIIFPSEIYHEVPVQKTNEKRIMIAGNLQIK
tara:strand:+ start:66 stop:647 length:582 start_codon:yes stop_codon:yes gene_type:complete